MRRRNPMLAYFLISIVAIIEIIAYLGGRILLFDWGKTGITGFYSVVYLTETCIVILLTILIPMLMRRKHSYVKSTYYSFQAIGIAMADLLPKLLFSLFVIISLIVQGAYVIFDKLIFHSAKNRLDLETLLIIGGLLGIFLLAAIIRGIIIGRFDFRVVRQALDFDNLPRAFEGLKIVQISDMHIGSFYNHHDRVQEAIELINELSPDLILFTGDMVNNTAEETKGWKEIFAGLRASMGKFSILGNHDYGDYIRWSSEEAKKKNLQELIDFERSAGFDIMLNENRIIERNGEKIAIIGVENWGNPPFARYGYLPDAMRGTEHLPFSILMSHDPSHWDEEVFGKTHIDLTLSGHTHGMQFGIIIGNWKWSPVQWRYERWGGLYRHNGQCLYVNRGLGHIGFPGRVGMLPEITLIELRRTNVR